MENTMTTIVKEKNLEQVNKITKQDIVKLFCSTANEKEAELCLGIVKSMQLNPFTREIHFVKFDNKLNIIVGYETYIKRAERTGKLDWWKVNLKDNLAICTIKRKDWSEPFVWEVNINEFNKKQATWNSMPSFMAKKVAIAQAFRLCFPDELGGMPYIQEEHDIYNFSDNETKGKPEVEIPTENEVVETKVEQEVNIEPENDQNWSNVKDLETIKEGDLLTIKGTVVSNEKKISKKGAKFIALKISGNSITKDIYFWGDMDFINGDTYQFNSVSIKGGYISCKEAIKC